MADFITIVALVVLTIVYFYLYYNSHTMISTSPEAAAQGWLGVLITCGIAAAATIAVVYLLGRWLFGLIVEYWWILLIGFGLLCYFSSDKEKAESTQDKTNEEKERGRTNIKKELPAPVSSDRDEVSDEEDESEDEVIEYIEEHPRKYLKVDSNSYIDKVSVKIYEMGTTKILNFLIYNFVYDDDGYLSEILETNSISYFTIEDNQIVLTFDKVKEVKSIDDLSKEPIKFDGEIHDSKTFIEYVKTKGGIVKKDMEIYAALCELLYLKTSIVFDKDI